jgi:hypothetical protein
MSTNDETAGPTIIEQVATDAEARQRREHNQRILARQADHRASAAIHDLHLGRRRRVGNKTEDETSGRIPPGQSPKGKG